MQLSQPEASDLSQLFASKNTKHQATITATPWGVDKELVEKGKRLFVKLNCVQCHMDVTGNRPGPSSTQAALDALIPTRVVYPKRLAIGPTFT